MYIYILVLALMKHTTHRAALERECIALIRFNVLMVLCYLYNITHDYQRVLTMKTRKMVRMYLGLG